jgi:hypothetical protein
MQALTLQFYFIHFIFSHGVCTVLQNCASHVYVLFRIKREISQDIFELVHLFVSKKLVHLWPGEIFAAGVLT